MQKTSMKSFFYLMLVFFLGACASSNSTKLDDIPSADLHVMGRSLVGEQGLELITSAAHFGVSFNGKECKLVVSLPEWQHHNYLQYELDGVYQKRIRIEKGMSDTITISAPSSGQHTLWIFKATEAHTGPIFIRSVMGNEVKSLSIPKQPLIEFIGNSITCGAASDPSEIPCGTGEYHDQHNAYMAYGPRVARTLGTNFILSSVSGIGIYRNWNSDRPVMPSVYEKADFQEEGTRPWDFNTFQPDIVSIALGTNDFSRGDGKRPRLPFDSDTYVREYVKYVKIVKSKYPKAQLAFLNSPMVSGSDNEIFVDCLNKVKRQIDGVYPSDKPVAIFLFTAMSPRGCTYHPSVEDHHVMAEQLAPFFEKLLK